MADPVKDHQPELQESDDETLVPEAEVSHDSELMTLHVAAVPVPSSRQFSTHRDEHGKPFVISSGNDGHLYAIKESEETGSRKLVDLSDAFGLDPKDDDVISFESVQDPDDDRIFLTFVTKDEKGKTYLNLCRPFHPNSIDVDLGEKLDLKEMLIPHKNKDERITLAKVWIGPKTPDFHYPEVVISYKSPAEINGASDVARVKVTDNFSSFEVMSDFEIPEDASGVDDIVPATTAVGRGYFCLYTLQGQKRLIFATTDKINGYGFKVPLTCPPQAKALATYRDPETGKSCLVVGADGLFVWDVYQGVQQGHAGRQITAGEDFFDVTQLNVTQYGTLLSVFATNEAQGVIYGHCKDLDFKEPLKAVPLVPDFAGGCFSPFVAADGNTQQLLVAGKGGSLSLLQQDGVTLAWKNQPFYIPNMKENIEYPGYMVNIVVTEKDNEAPMVESVFRLRSSGFDNVIVNGRNMAMSPEGVLVKTDESGSINMMIASDDIACDVYYLENPGDKDYPDLLPAGEVITIDPAEKVWKRLAEIKNGKDLKNFKTSSGKPLDFHGKLSEKDMDEIAAAIGAAATERGKRLENGDYIDGPAPAAGSGDSDDPGAWPITIGAIKEVDSFKDAIQLGLDGLRWILKKAKQLVKFVVRKTVNGLDVLLETKAGSKFRWVINGIKSAAMMIGTILEGFLDVLDKVVDFLGYLMDFEGAKKPMDALVAEHEKEMADGGKPEKDDPRPNRASAGDNYAEYQMRHGGGEDGVQDEEPVSDGVVGDDTLSAVWNDLIVPLMESLGDMVRKNLENFGLLFNRKDNLNIAEVFQKMGADFLLGAIEIFQKLIVGILRVIGAILKDFVDGVNKRIFIPVISPWWKKMTGGDLTVLSVIALLVAIPANALIKTTLGDPDVDLDFTDDTTLVEHLDLLGSESLMDSDDEDEDGEAGENGYDEDDDDDDDESIPEGASIASLAQSQLGALAELSIARSQVGSPPGTARSSLQASPTARQSLGAVESQTPIAGTGPKGSSLVIAPLELGQAFPAALDLGLGPAKSSAGRNFAGRATRSILIAGGEEDVLITETMPSFASGISTSEGELLVGVHPLFPIGSLSPAEDVDSASVTDSESGSGTPTTDQFRSSVIRSNTVGVRTAAAAASNGGGQPSEKSGSGINASGTQSNSTKPKGVCLGGTNCVCQGEDPSKFDPLGNTPLSRKKGRIIARGTTQAIIAFCLRYLILRYKFVFTLLRSKKKTFDPNEVVPSRNRENFYQDRTNMKGAKFWKWRDILASLVLAAFIVPYHNLGIGRMPMKSDYSQDLLDKYKEFLMCENQENLSEVDAQKKVDKFEADRRALVKVKKQRFMHYGIRVGSPLMGLVLFMFNARAEFGAFKDMGMGLLAFSAKITELAIEPRNDGDGKDALMKRRWALAGLGLTSDCAFSAATLAGKEGGYFTIGSMLVGTGAFFTGSCLQAANTIRELRGKDGASPVDEFSL